jgi:ABC-2 type transport system ATP-binding protein
MDHGTIVAQGTSAELKQQTGTESLEAAFLALTGSSLRDEAATSKDALRQVAQMFGRR